MKKGMGGEREIMSMEMRRNTSWSEYSLSEREMPMYDAEEGGGLGVATMGFFFFFSLS